MTVGPASVQALLVHGQPAPEALRSLGGAGWQGHVWVTEGRPLLRGARGTAPSLLRAGYRPTLISDNMVAYCMWKGLVDAALICYWWAEAAGLSCAVGALGVAISAAHHRLPCYALPAIDEASPPANADDLFDFLGQRVAAKDADAFVPATDCVPWRWVTRAWDVDGAVCWQGEASA